MSDTDLILRAVSDGNPACPDGPALARLGALVRTHSQPQHPVALTGLVRSRLESDSVRIEERTRTPIQGSEVDACWDEGMPAAADLVRLGELLRALGPPAAVDLRARVRARLNESQHRRAILTVVPASRWRLWSAVILGHLVAVLAIALFQSAMHDSRSAAADTTVTTQPTGPRPPSHTLPDTRPVPGTGPGVYVWPCALPAGWTDIHRANLDLFLPRRSAAAREQLRHCYHLDGGAVVVSEGLAWLTQQQQADGHFGATHGATDRDRATQALACLALLGEGTDDPSRAAHVRAGLTALADDVEAATDPEHVATALAALALVEGHALLDDPALGLRAETLLHQLEDGQRPQPGAAGLGGFELLALEAAAQSGLDVPQRRLEEARLTLARSLPDNDDVGRIGLAAFARFAYGQRAAASTPQLVHGLLDRLPARASDGTTDPLGWFFATLALREAGGAAWDAWSHALVETLTGACQPAGPGLCRLPANACRHADAQDGDLFATSLALLDLQAAYRYLPVAATHSSTP